MNSVLSLGRVRAQAVETARAHMVRPAPWRLRRACSVTSALSSTANSARPCLDDDGLVGGGDDLALERLGIDVEAQRRNLGLTIEDVELEAADVGRHRPRTSVGICADGLGIHWELGWQSKNSRPQGGCPWGEVDGTRHAPGKENNQRGEPHRSLEGLDWACLPATPANMRSACGRRRPASRGIGTCRHRLRPKNEPRVEAREVAAVTRRRSAVRPAPAHRHRRPACARRRARPGGST